MQRIAIFTTDGVGEGATRIAEDVPPETVDVRCLSRRG